MQAFTEHWSNQPLAPLIEVITV